MSVLKPDLFDAEVVVPANGLIRTPFTANGGGILIGSRHVAKPAAPYGDHETLQRALLEKRTAQPLPLIHRIASAIWRWF